MITLTKTSPPQLLVYLQEFDKVVGEDLLKMIFVNEVANQTAKDKIHQQDQQLITNPNKERYNRV